MPNLRPEGPPRRSSDAVCRNEAGPFSSSLCRSRPRLCTSAFLSSPHLPEWLDAVSSFRTTRISCRICPVVVTASIEFRAAPRAATPDTSLKTQSPRQLSMSAVFQLPRHWPIGVACHFDTDRRSCLNLRRLTRRLSISRSPPIIYASHSPNRGGVLSLTSRRLPIGVRLRGPPLDNLGNFQPFPTVFTPCNPEIC